MGPSLKICFAAAEVAPWVKTGGLADVAAGLPARLSALGHDVRLFVPLHFVSRLQDGALDSVPGIVDVPVEVGWRTHTFSARTSTLPGTSQPVFWIDCPELFDRPAVYTAGDDDARRFTLFSRAVVECCQRMGWAPDIFHCNDWHAALIPFLLRTVYQWDALFARSRKLVTIHNLGYQGLFPASLVGELGLESWAHLLDQQDLGAGRLNFLRTGIVYSDAISTVSPAYAREIQTEEYGMGLADLLRGRRDTLVGILNGVDYAQWSPETDPHIPRHFSAAEIEGKRENKRHLLETLKLDGDLTAPLAGVVSRFAHQKGFDLCFEVLPEFLSGTDLRLVALGSGEARYEEFFADLQRRFPRTVCYHRGYNDPMAHAIEAASDLFLMPSRYEPCGLNQMFSMRYGTLPVVRRTGGLADSVIEVDPTAGSGTGFVFEHFTADGLRWALGRALDAWRDPTLWRRLMLNAMSQDFSWDKQVGSYVELYRNLVSR